MTRFWSNFVKKWKYFYYWRCSMPAASPYIQVHGAQSRYLQLEIVFREAALHIIVVYVDYIYWSRSGHAYAKVARAREHYIWKKKKKKFSSTRAGSDILSVCLSVCPSVRSQKNKMSQIIQKVVCIWQNLILPQFYFFGPWRGVCWPKKLFFFYFFYYIYYMQNYVLMPNSAIKTCFERIFLSIKKKSICI